jgi:iron-sulfur cluster assembly accessory protein
VFEKGGAHVVVDKTSLEHIRGATIDYEQEMIRSSFVVIGNPNADSSCGCGVSFNPRF